MVGNLFVSGKEGNMDRRLQVLPLFMVFARIARPETIQIPTA
jgi:hypothetical protein